MNLFGAVSFIVRYQDRSFRLKANETIIIEGIIEH